LNEFRNLFGWYMQRVAAGERFLVTRRGKPYVRLIPATHPPTLTPPAEAESHA
jgi:prevent-host-death family protein